MSTQTTVSTPLPPSPLGDPVHGFSPDLSHYCLSDLTKARSWPLVLNFPTVSEADPPSSKPSPPPPSPPTTSPTSPPSLPTMLPAWASSSSSSSQPASSSPSSSSSSSSLSPAVSSASLPGPLPAAPSPLPPLPSLLQSPLYPLFVRVLTSDRALKKTLKQITDFIARLASCNLEGLIDKEVQALGAASKGAYGVGVGVTRSHSSSFSDDDSSSSFDGGSSPYSSSANAPASSSSSSKQSPSTNVAETPRGMLLNAARYLSQECRRAALEDGSFDCLLPLLQCGSNNSDRDSLSATPSDVPASRASLLPPVFPPLSLLYLLGSEDSSTKLWQRLVRSNPGGAVLDERVRMHFDTLKSFVREEELGLLDWGVRDRFPMQDSKTQRLCLPPPLSPVWDPCLRLFADLPDASTPFDVFVSCQRIVRGLSTALSSLRKQYSSLPSPPLPSPPPPSSSDSSPTAATNTSYSNTSFSGSNAVTTDDLIPCVALLCLHGSASLAPSVLWALDYYLSGELLDDATSDSVPVPPGGVGGGEVAFAVSTLLAGWKFALSIPADGEGGALIPPPEHLSPLKGKPSGAKSGASSRYFEAACKRYALTLKLSTCAKTGSDSQLLRTLAGDPFVIDPDDTSSTTSYIDVGGDPNCLIANGSGTCLTHAIERHRDDCVAVLLGEPASCFNLIVAAAATTSTSSPAAPTTPWPSPPCSRRGPPPWNLNLDVKVNEYHGAKRGRTALTLAIAAGSTIGLIAALLRRGADRNVKDNDAMTPIDHITVLRNEATVKRDARRVAELDDIQRLIRCDPQSVFIYDEARKGEIQNVYMLLLQGVDPNMRDPTGAYTALIAATFINRVDVVDLLLEDGGVKWGTNVNDVNVNGETALMHSVQQFVQGSITQQISMAAKLLSAGAERAALDCRGRDAKRWAQDRKLHLLEDFFAYDPTKNNMCQLAKLKDLRGVRSLMLQGVSANVKDTELGFTPLIASVYNGDVRMASVLLQFFDESGTNYSDNQQQPQHGDDEASASDALLGNGERQIVQQLVKANVASVNLAGRGGMTAIHYCAQEGSAAMMALLLKCGGDRYQKDDAGRTGLDIAKAKKHTEVEKLIVNDPNRVSIAVAAGVAEWDDVFSLLRQGAGVNSRHVVLRDVGAPPGTAANFRSTTFLDYVSRWAPNAQHCTTQAQAHNQKVVHELFTPLIAACSHNRVVTFTNLMSCRGIDVNLTNMHKQTPLMYAAACGNMDLILPLLKRNADRKAVDDKGRTAIDWATLKGMIKAAKVIKYDPAVFTIVDAAGMDDVDGIAALLLQGIDVNVLVKGSTAIVAASKAGAFKAIEALGAVPGLLWDSEDSNGETALMASCRLGNISVVSTLLKRGARRDVRATNLALSAGQVLCGVLVATDPYIVSLHDACAAGKVLAVDALLVQGVSVNASDKRVGSRLASLTPLMSACLHVGPGRRGRAALMVVERLLSHKRISVNAKNSRGETALMIAASIGDISLCKLLILHGADKDAVDNNRHSASWWAYHGRETYEGWTEPAALVGAQGAPRGSVGGVGGNLSVAFERPSTIDVESAPDDASPLASSAGRSGGFSTPPPTPPPPHSLAQNAQQSFSPASARGMERWSSAEVGGAASPASGGKPKRRGNTPPRGGGLGSSIRYSLMAATTSPKSGGVAKK